MWSRMRLDIGWRDIAFGLASSVLSTGRDAIQRRVERRWSREGDALACLSVRSGFDLLLTSLDLPPGSEVLVSALTIRDMTRIIEEHGLTPVPIDLNMNRLAPLMSSLERAVTPRTRAILVAHLFGTRINLEPVFRFARERGLMVIEDCAQAYVGPSFTGHPQADVSMFSFGPIKTSTALCGGLFKVRDRALLDDMRARQRQYPVQNRRFFAKRVLKYSGLKLGSTLPIYSLLVRLWRAWGMDYDQIVGSTVKGFPGPMFFERIRQQPSAPLLAMLERRLMRFNARGLAERTAKGEQLAELIGETAYRPGERAPRHSYWVFPVMTDKPEELLAAMRAAGFDATKGHSLCVVEPPAGQPECEPRTARESLQSFVFLPWFADLPLAALERMAGIVREVCGTQSASVQRWREVADEPLDSMPTPEKLPAASVRVRV